MDTPVLELQFRSDSAPTSIEIRVRYLEDQVKELTETISRLTGSDQLPRLYPEDDALAAKIWKITVATFHSRDSVRHSKRRFYFEIKIRHSAMFVMAVMGLRISQIARFFDCHHTNICSAVKTMTKRIQTDRTLFAQVEQIKTQSEL